MSSSRKSAFLDMLSGSQSAASSTSLASATTQSKSKQPAKQSAVSQYSSTKNVKSKNSQSKNVKNEITQKQKSQIQITQNKNSQNSNKPIRSDLIRKTVHVTEEQLEKMKRIRRRLKLKDFEIEQKIFSYILDNPTQTTAVFGQDTEV